MTTETNTFQQHHGLLGSSLEMQEIVQVIQQVAPTDITVLISGESGTGKEVVAQAIHAASKRAAKPVITVNCGAIPEGIIESELFGHEKGSFTGASDTRKGYFELADGGTIFLDEIGELPISTQVKFLRILENGEFMRVGSSIARRVDVRVIAATNKELEAEVRNNRFRQDLFFRLRSINMRIPPLRERREDIPLLFDHFAREFSARNGMTYVGIDQDAMNTLQNYHWPGNVRELRNVVESMLVMSNNKRIADSDVRRYLRGYQLGEDRNLPVIIPKMTEFAERELIYRALVDLKGDILELKSIVANALSNNGSSLHRTSGTDSDRRGTPVIPVQQTGLENMSLEEIERKMIIDSLQRYNGSRRMAAQALKISERTLYRKIKEYGLQ